MPASYEPILFFILPPGILCLQSVYFFQYLAQEKMEASARKKELVSRRRPHNGSWQDFLLSMLVNNIAVRALSPLFI